MRHVSDLAIKFCSFHNSSLPAFTDEQHVAARSHIVSKVQQEYATMIKIPDTKKTGVKKSASRKLKNNPKAPSTHPANRGRAKPAKARNPVQARRALKTEPKPATRRISGRDIGEATCVPGGITMEALVKRFGIEAHPMRAKIFYAKHTLGFTIEHKDGAYHGTAPK